MKIKIKLTLLRIFVLGVVRSLKATHYPSYRLGSSWLHTHQAFYDY
jgi:hypothetical protein